MTARIFTDLKLQQQFDQDGFVVLPFLNADEVKKLTALFEEMHPKTPEKKFYSSTFSDQPEFKKRITDFTETIYAPKIDSLFQDIKKLGSSFLCKSPGTEGKMPVHQDWTVVDESKFYSATIWVPLVDTNEANGAIRVLRGSHRFTGTLRAPTLTSEYENVKDSIWNQMEVLPIKAGEAFVFNHALIHASSPNSTQKERVAVTYGMIPRQAQLLLYHSNGNGRVEKYAMPDDMFLKYDNIGQRPAFGEKVDEFDYKIKQMRPLKLHHLLTKARRERNMTPLFSDPAAQEFFEREGYVKIKMLGDKEVKELLNFFYSLNMKDEAGLGWHISMDNDDKQFVGKVMDKIFEVALPKAAPHFKNAKAYVASFVIKEPTLKGVVPVHQDWSFVDEEDKYCTVSCWIPLVDVTVDSGAIGVVRGSHKFFTNHRPSPSPQAPVPLAEHMFTIFPYMKVIEMKAGEALIFDNRTFHGSPPNSTDKPRIAFGIGFTQQDAQLRHYYMKPDGKKNTLLKYKVDKDFFRKYGNVTLSKMYDKGELIKGYELEGEIPYVLPEFTGDELIELAKEYGNEFNAPMCEKLAALFSYNMDGSKKEEPKKEIKPEPKPEPEPVSESAVMTSGSEKPLEWNDDRNFFQKYTPANILKEVKKRV